MRLNKIDRDYFPETKPHSETHFAHSPVFSKRKKKKKKKLDMLKKNELGHQDSLVSLNFSEPEFLHLINIRIAPLSSNLF